MADEAVHYYSQQFSQEELIGDENLLSLIPFLIDQNRNDLLCQMPSVDEVKKAVFNLSGSSASGPDGFPGNFYQICWDIISLDVYKMVVSFFQGHTLPKSVTHTNLVLLPKKELVQSFVQGRSIIENVLLAQEIVIDIRKKGKLANLVIKLDMAIAYDRVSWLNLIKAKGFFHSTRGVKQSDPISPALFILSAEVLSRALNAEFDNTERGVIEENYEDTAGVEQITGFKRDQFPLNYLGCPIFHSRRKKVYYNDLIKKVKNKLQNWKGKLLSSGGKAVLINSVLQSIPIYMLSAVVPTKFTINELHKIFARFYWSTNEEGKSRHLVLLGQEEEAYRSAVERWITSVEKNDRSKGSGGSTDMVIPPDFQIDTSIEELSHFMNAEGWDVQKLHDKLPSNVCDHILQELSIVEPSEEKDKTWWMASTTGYFTVGSAWNLLRKKAQTSAHFSKLWFKGVPFKISFFLWILWKFKITVDDVLKKMNINIVSRCRCCLNPHQEETVQHLFLIGEFAAETWQYYNAAVGIIVPRIQIHQTIVQWWYMQGPTKLKSVMQAAPTFICWQLWKRRNTIMHGGKMNKLKLINGINYNLQQLVNTLNPWLRNIPHDWPHMVKYLEDYRPRIGYKMVQWKFLDACWFKCNTDGASRGNPGLSSAAFCIRDEVGNLIYARARRISNTTNITAESVAILHGIEFCIKNYLVLVMIKSDSLSMINIIQGIWEIPWKISTVHFHSFAKLPAGAKKILNADKMMIPNFISKIYRNREPN
ncbi:uncharacterized protein LOC132612794 [Lycium barbarum]|uniref:uncharacterized protein LOC132612794 n=1 Tax=Lycium barbarum TaxID=112863 RepID=UPI00293F6379|nr:uncharacterized protein LOC132612794 [Lycium barbarum]